MAHGDIEIPARNGCRFLKLSDGAVAALLSGNHFTVQEVDRAKRLLLLADMSDRVVTVLKSSPERRPRGSRRDRNWR
jgi:hypothetical protein